MKFICTQENLIAGLNCVSHITNKNTTLPILNNVKLVVNKNGLEISATNLEQAVVTTVRGRVELEGGITVPARLLVEAVFLLNKENITLELNNQDLVVKGGKNRTVLRGVPVDDFPVIPQPENGLLVEFPSKGLVNALERVNFAVSLSDSRPEINAVYLYIKENNLVVVGTDSYRLAQVTLPLPNKLTELGSLLLPVKTSQEVVRLFAGSDDLIRLLLNDNQVVWQQGEVRIISRLVTGQYPDYQQIIPEQTNTNLQINRNELIQAVKAASLFVRVGINDVRLEVDTNQKSLIVSSVNSQLGENTSQLTPCLIEGETIQAIFNYRYLLDGLLAIADEEVVLGLVNSNSPALLKPTKQADYLYLLMPIRQ